jgi:hypothetical protein
MNPAKETAEQRIKDTLEVIRDLGLSDSDILNIVKQNLGSRKQEITLPIIIFKTDELSSLEAIVKYLRENLLLTFKQIGELTNRNQITLSVSYRSAAKKHKEKFPEVTSAYNIPVSILKDRKKSVLENIVFYLKENFNLTYHNIAVLLNRNDRTVWTVYQRAIKKNG